MVQIQSENLIGRSCEFNLKDVAKGDLRGMPSWDVFDEQRKATERHTVYIEGIVRAVFLNLKVVTFVIEVVRTGEVFNEKWCYLFNVAASHVRLKVRKIV